VKWGTGESAVEPLRLTVPARAANRLSFTATSGNAMAADVLVSSGVDLIVGGAGGVAVIHTREGVLSNPHLIHDGCAPTGIAVVDFNGDGLNDVAMACADGRVAILLNRGGDGFSSPRYSVAGAHPSAIVAADFNGDGIPDLAVANQDDNHISILYGKGDGSFQAAMTVPTGYSPRALVAADFNGDGIADLASANFATNDVSILLGDGHGGFLAAGAFAVGSGPVNLVAADFDEDGAADLAVLNQIDGSLSLLRNDGAGIFRTVGSMAGVSAVAAGDIDGDGHVDLVLHAGNEIAVRLGAGDGSFVEGYRLGAVGSPLLLAVHGLGNVVAMDSGGAVSLFSGRIASSELSGRFTAGQTTKNDGLPSGGHLDPLASSASSTGLTVSANPIVFGQPLTLSATVTPSNATGKVTFFDGTTPLGSKTLANGQATLTTSMLPSNAQSLKVYYPGDGNFTASTSPVVVETVTALTGGGFQTPVSYAAGLGPSGVAIADLNGDGKADIVVADAGTYPNYAGSVTVLLGNGNGTFQSLTGYSTSSGSTFVAVADVNGDGTPDLLVVNWSGSVSVLIGNGNGTFQPAVNYDVGNSPFALAVGDFNGDGIVDIAVASNGSNSVSLLLGAGNGTFNAGPTFAASLAPEAILAGDFNGDGIADLAVAGSNGVAVLLGTGNANFRPAVIYAAGTNPYSIAQGDFNGDGKIDLAVANLDGGNVSVLLGNGNGTFGAAVNYAAGTNSEAVVVGDFNGDGYADLAVANFGPSSGSGGNLSVLYGNGNGTFLPAQSYLAGDTPFGLAVGNFNGDGRLDLVALDLNRNAVDILVASPAFPPSVYIDTPSAGVLVTSGKVTITGWAIDNTNSVGTSIASVVVKVDGVVVGNASYGISRTDVCTVYPGRAGCPYVGYSFVLYTGTLTSGAHTITVSATDSDVTPDTGTASVTITVSNGQLPIVYIDTPAQGSVVTGPFTVTGWAVDSSSSGTAISSVQVKLDGTSLGTANYGISRVDVCSVYTGRPGCPNVGYTYSVNPSTLPAGTHTITVSATDSAATPYTGSASVTVSIPSAPPSVYIDTPAAGSVLSGTATVTGWAIDSTVSVGAPIGGVLVKVDGTVVGNATYGLSRVDVCNVYPARAGCPNVGFSYALNTTKLSPGTHTLTVVATGTDGSSGSSSVPVQVAPPPSVFIDSIAQGATISGTVSVAGWAIDNTTTVGTAISSVQVELDGTLVGNAVYGSSRVDVCQVYPGRPGCPNVGFTYQLNTASLSAGTHVITVLATDSDASPDTGSYSVTVTK
jgi:hypothetical protein